MHITIVTKNMNAGGAERVIAQMLSQWDKIGVTCSLVCMEPTELFYTIPERVDHYDMPRFSGNPLVNKLKKYAALRKRMGKIKPNVILAMPENIGIYVLLIMLGTGIPVVVSERNNPWVMPYKKMTRLLRRFAYPFAAGLIFQTKQAMSFFPASQQKKGIVLDNPLERSRIPEAFAGERNKTVVSAGRLDDQKNYSLLIRAFSAFQKNHPEYKLVIYGEGPKRQKLENLAEELLPAGTWQMPGQTEDLPGIIAPCSMFVLSSDYEGVPNVLIEAMACGMPVISTDCAPGGAASLIENKVNGLLVPLGNTEALAEGMCYLADHPVEAAEMGEHALEIKQRLDAEQVCMKWLTYLQGVGSRE